MTSHWETVQEYLQSPDGKINRVSAHRATSVYQENVLAEVVLLLLLLLLFCDLLIRIYLIVQIRIRINVCH